MSVDTSSLPDVEVEPSVEIDVEEVVARLRPFAAHELDVLPDFNLECAVDWIAPKDQIAFAISACPVCGGNWAQPRFAIAKTQFRVADCIQCGLGRLHPLPNADLIGRFYPASYYGVTGAKFVPLVESLVRLVGARHLQALSRGLPSGARVLDVGCGRGVLLASLADRGFETHGFEISDAATAGADSRAVIRIGRKLGDAEYPDHYFDQVILWHVLEHLPDPRETLSEIRRILKPGGRLVVAVPNYSSAQAEWAGPAWFHLDPPRHLFHFPVRGLWQLLENVGFVCRSEHHFSLRQNPFGWVQSALNRCRRLPRNGLYSLLKSRDDSAALYDCLTRTAFRFAYWCGMPIACVLSVVDALRKDGASVCIVATTRCD